MGASPERCEHSCPTVLGLRSELLELRRATSRRVSGAMKQRGAAVYGRWAKTERAEKLEGLLRELLALVPEVPELAEAEERQLADLVDRCRRALGPVGKTDTSIPRRTTQKRRGQR